MPETPEVPMQSQPVQPEISQTTLPPINPVSQLENTVHPVHQLGQKRKAFLITAITLGAVAGIAAGVVVLNMNNPKQLPHTTTLKPTVVAVSPTEEPTPSPKTNENWEVYTSSDSAESIRFQYPPKLKAVANGTTSIDFVDAASNPEITFQNDIKARILISQSGSLYTALRNAEVLDTVNDPSSGFQFTKTGEQQIGTNMAVDYEIVHAEGQPKQMFITGTIVQQSSTYYDISASRNTKAELDEFKPIFKQILESVTFTEAE